MKELLLMLELLGKSGRMARFARASFNQLNDIISNRGMICEMKSRIGCVDRHEWKTAQLLPVCNATAVVPLQHRDQLPAVVHGFNRNAT
jgi:hypothetical protein